MTAARRQSSLPPVHRLTEPAGPVDGVNARGKMQGKIKGRGTRPLENPVCTWRWRGTRQWGAACRESAQCRFGVGEGACFARLTASVLDGATR
jgi:hypothetical protein